MGWMCTHDSTATEYYVGTFQLKVAHRFIVYTALAVTDVTGTLISVPHETVYSTVHQTHKSRHGGQTLKSVPAFHSYPCIQLRHTRVVAPAITWITVEHLILPKMQVQMRLRSCNEPELLKLHSMLP